MDDVSGAGSLGPREKKMYEQEYKHGADLFKRALDQYTKADNPYKQAEFKDVMDKAMNVLNETASELMRKELISQNDRISKDYEAFQKFPDDPDKAAKLNRDLDQAKKSVS